MFEKTKHIIFETEMIEITLVVILLSIPILMILALIVKLT